MGFKKSLTYLCSKIACYDVRKWKSPRESEGESAAAGLSPEERRPRLAELPTDMILAITDQLEDCESRVLLSLVCKRFHGILSTYIKPSLVDHGARVRFLQIYERDLLDELTCHICGRLIRWRSSSGRHAYRWHATSLDCGNPADRRFDSIRTNLDCISIRRELVDLILKADELGEEYGLPVSLLNVQSDGSQDHRGTCLTSRARLIRGELLFATSSVTKSSSWEDARKLGWLLYCSICPASHTTIQFCRFWEGVCATASETNGSSETELLKCLHCRTQFRFSLLKSLSDNMIVIKVRVWKSFGTRYDNSLCNEQMFRWGIVSQAVINSLSKRDLQTEFDSDLIE